MSSVWKDATLEQLIAAGQKYGYQAVEFRPEWKHAHGVELTASAADRQRIARTLRDGGLPGCCLSPGPRFNSPDPQKRQAELAKLMQYIDLAADTGIGLVRVFGDPLPNGGGGGRAAAYRILADAYGLAAAHAAKAGVRLVLETHANCRAFDVGEILFQAGYPPALWVNWHLGHCLRNGEDVDEAYRHIKGRVAHVHFGISEKEQAGVPALQRQWELLRDEGYAGCWSVEVIDPPDPQEVLQKHAAAWPTIARSA